MTAATAAAAIAAAASHLLLAEIQLSSETVHLLLQLLHTWLQRCQVARLSACSAPLELAAVGLARGLGQLSLQKFLLCLRKAQLGAHALQLQLQPQQ